MDNSFQLLAVAFLGLVVGAGGVWAAWISESHYRERKNAAAGIYASLEPRMLALLAALPGVAIILGEDNEVIRADAAAYAQGLLRGKSVANKDLMLVVGDVRKYGEIVQREFELPRGNLETGDTLPLMVRVAPLGGGKILILAQDISAARRVEQARRDFTANISHELKTPVGAISLLAETIENNAENTEAVRDFSHRLRKESKRLSALISDIIDLSRLQTPDALARPERVRLEDVMVDAVEMMLNTAQQNQIELDCTYCGEELEVWGDPELLTMALRNLIDNAIRYSPAGTRVQIDALIGEDRVNLRVIDQGIGIAKPDQERIFERFYRVDAGRSRATGGTGLGLSIVKHVAADHGGRVWVQSLPGFGSTFNLELPLPTDGRVYPSSQVVNDTLE
ncbi:two-component sensor histidine kinase [Actinomycetaceae bacterium TAE3-ERU4]|nr:two-component sensor histidine kinase [Actinomycetaceae bacterium TAE3-ERU4]